MPVFARNVVATSQPLAASVGLETLRRGGNAMDAALATAICLTVVEPTSNGIGSDAFALIWSGGELQGLNASGKSPANWDVSRFDGMEQVPLRGWDAVTVPGAVDAWVQCSRRFGRMPFSELFDGALRYAEDGFHVSPVIGLVWARAAEAFKGFPAFYDTFMPGDKAPEIGSIMFLPDHAETLRLIAESEGEAFYRGEIAEKIVKDAEANGAAMSLDDLAQHESEWVEPISIGFHGVDLNEIPPNGQGLAALIALGVLRHTPVLDFPIDSADSVHHQIEAMKIAFAEVFAHLSDPATMRASVDELLDDTYLKKQADSIDPKSAGKARSMLAAAPSTVYLCTADDEGMMVSFIQSNYYGFGSGVVVPGTGIALQNRGCGFTLEKDHPNEAAPGKRPFHTIIPGFVTSERGLSARIQDHGLSVREPAPMESAVLQSAQDDNPAHSQNALMAFGVMGGHMQAQGHVQTVLRTFGHGQNPQAASDAPRWQVSEDGEVLLEEGFDTSVADNLAAREHKVKTNMAPGHFGGGQYILKLEDGYCAASDHRKDGCALGF
ncbi:MAG: gamma-glutamyltransferase family protein [Armatimonadetes bacterium]|nr:gamma-glutamyltransferase family protein [Armatimonadota bacterium]